VPYHGVMRRLAILSCVVACSTRTPAPTSPSSTPTGTSTATSNSPAPARGGFQPDAAYAALFQDGTEWSLDVVATKATRDEENPAADADGWVRSSTTGRGACRVVKTIAFEGGVASQVDCDYGVALKRSHDPLTGVWVADADGLYWHQQEQMPVGSEPEHTESQRLLTVPLAPLHDEGSFIDGSYKREIVQRGGAWCWSYEDTAGSRRWQSLCVAPDGVTEGTWGETGQAWSFEYRFTRSR
jgi:hypothetical protein